MQIKTIVLLHATIRMAKIKTLTKLSTGEDVVQLLNSHKLPVGMPDHIASPLHF